MFYLLKLVFRLILLFVTRFMSARDKTCNEAKSSLRKFNQWSQANQHISSSDLIEYLLLNVFQMFSSLTSE